MSRKRPDPKIETRLSSSDMEMFNNLSLTSQKTRADLAREAILWYMHHFDDLKEQPKENASAQATRYATDQIVKAINGAVDRICKMLARQGRAIATLYELSWMSLTDDEARSMFQEAASRAKLRMAQHVEKDESELAERMKKVVNG